MWKRKRKTEWLPWYRARDYKGNLTEEQKRELDAFRMQPTHPAAQLDCLPQEVQDYVGKIEMELYDKKQEMAAGRAFALSAIGAALLWLNYKGYLGGQTFWSLFAVTLLLIVPWFYYRYEWKKNAEEFLPSDHSHNPTDEAIRQQWELNYIVHSHEQRRSNTAANK
jgi:hypothetical protein